MGILESLGIRSRNNSVLGVDFGASSIKIVQVARKHEQSVLETYGELSVGAYEGKEVGRVLAVPEERMSAMLKDLAKEAEAKCMRIAVAVPLRYSFVTTIQLPELSQSEFASAVQFESRKYVPLPIDEVVLDWERIALSEQERAEVAGKVPVLIAASQKEVRDRYDRIVKSAGYEKESMEIEVFSTTRAVIGRERATTMILDIGAATSKCIIAEHGSVRSAYGVDKGGQQLSLTLSQAMSVDFVTAERMKRESGVRDVPDNHEQRETLLPVLDSIFEEGERMRTFWRRKTSRPIERIILTGGGSLLPGIVEHASAYYGTPVYVGNPFSMLEYPTVMEGVAKDIGPAFSVAVGLALKGIRARE